MLKAKKVNAISEVGRQRNHAEKVGMYDLGQRLVRVARYCRDVTQRQGRTGLSKRLGKFSLYGPHNRAFSPKTSIHSCDISDDHRNTTTRNTPLPSLLSLSLPNVKEYSPGSPGQRSSHCQ